MTGATVELARNTLRESDVLALAARSGLGAQLMAALEATPDVVAADDEKVATYAHVARRAIDIAEEQKCADTTFVALQSRNDLEFVSELIGAMLARRVPVLYLPGQSRPDLTALRRGTPDGDGHAVDDDTALILTSGGTTGTPKLIPRTNADYLLNIWLTVRNAELSEMDSVQIPVPVGHNYGLGCPGVLGAIVAGARLNLTAETTLEGVVRAADRNQVSVMPLVPAHVRNWYGRSARVACPLRLIQIGGSVVSSRDVGELRTLFGAQVQASFGMAEGLLCQSAPDDDDELREAGAGRVLSEDDCFRIVEPDSSGLGHLEVRGPYTIARYLAPARINAERFTADGWFITGDCARAYDSRRFTVHGRSDDMINRGGELIDPESVETVTRAHPDVLDVVAVGRPHRRLGSLAVAFVTVRGDVSEDQVMRDLLSLDRSALALPDQVIVLPRIPLTEVGKADRSALLEHISTGEKK